MRAPFGQSLPRVQKPELAVLIAGVTSMGLEILAGRMIAPEFGSSIYTWGSIIGVFLAALSVGYYEGGKRAATKATVSELTTLLLWAAAYVAFLLFASDLLLRVSAVIPVPARFSPLVPVVLMFGPPVYLLGFISPYAAELSTRENTGEASGRVYALGTAGSIVGAFGTTFLLIPALSIEIIGLLFGGMLVITATRLAWPELTTNGALRIALVAIVLLASVSGPSLGISASGQVVYETQTAYQQLQVVDRGDVRTLYLDGQPHSAIDLSDTDRHVFTYTRYFHLPLLMTEDVDRVLFIGGGGFTGPRIFAETYDVEVDAVEIDPEVVRVAREYFRVEPRENLDIYTMDGRQFLQETDRTYDLIILDAYKKDKVPFQLTTREFFALTAQHLDEDGVLLANLISAPSGSGSKFFRAEYKTLETVYPQVYAFKTSNAGFVQNIEVVATKQATELTTAELRARHETRDIDYYVGDAIDRRVQGVQTDDVPVLRDGKAPVDSLLDPMLGRKYVIEQTGSGNGTEVTTVGESGVGAIGPVGNAEAIGPDGAAAAIGAG